MPTSLSHWHDLELRYLSYAIAVRDQLGFVPAAISLKLDQGFLSKQIRRLEKQIGFELFNRKTRPLTITPAGQLFLEEAERILLQTQRAVETAQEVRRGCRGRLDLGVNTSIANTLLSELLSVFQTQFPDVSVVLHELPSYEQIKQLENSRIDVGFFHRHSLRSAEEALATFETTSILSEPLLVVLPEAHRLASQLTVSLADLRQDLFVLPPYSLTTGLRQQIQQALSDANCHPKVVHEAAWITTVLSLVASGRIVSILPANARNLRRKGVVFVDIEERCPTLEIIAVRWLESASPIVENFFTTTKKISSAHRKWKAEKAHF